MSINIDSTVCMVVYSKLVVVCPRKIPALRMVQKGVKYRPLTPTGCLVIMGLIFEPRLGAHTGSTAMYHLVPYQRGAHDQTTQHHLHQSCEDNAQ